MTINFVKNRFEKSKTFEMILLLKMLDETAIS